MITKVLRFCLFALAGLAVLSSGGCLVNDETGTVYDPNAVSPRPNPTVTSISPQGGAFAGVDTLILAGTNFSVAVAENTVYFDKSPATPFSATSSQLKLVAPLALGDKISVKVAVRGAFLFSEPISYSLTAAVVSFGTLGPTDAAGGLATDATGNLYAAIKGETSNAKIYKITPAGVKTEYAPETGGTPRWGALRLGPGGYFYAARSVRAVYRFNPGGGSAAALWVAFPSGVFITDFDFDQSENLWAGGNNTNLYLIKQDKTTKSFPFAGNVRGLRVHSGHLYFAANTASGEAIWRAPISGDNLGTPEVYFDLTAAFSGKNLVPTSITFSSDGYLYIGTNAPEFVVIVTPTKASGAPYKAYTTLFGTGTLSFAWGSGDALYASSQSGALMKISTRKSSAPYYGR